MKCNEVTVIIGRKTPAELLLPLQIHQGAWLTG